MSILIKGMEMPKNEPLLVKINPDGSVSTTAKNGYKKYEAVPVPPHGRLIDADALADVFRGFIAMYDSCPFSQLSLPDKSRRDELQSSLAEVINAPTIIPAEEGGCSRYDHCRIAQTGTCQYAEEEKTKESLCLNCQSKTCWNEGFDTGVHNCKAYSPYQSDTNYSRIRSLSIYEMADELQVLIDEAVWSGEGKSNNELLEWLKSSAEEGE